MAPSTRIRHTSIYSEEWATPAIGHGPDGFYDTAINAGWRIYSAWGRDGWDTPQWPYVQYGTRRLHEGLCATQPGGGHAPLECPHDALEYCEGDLTITRFETGAAAITWLDILIVNAWRRRTQHEVPLPPDWKRPYGYTPPISELPDRFRGPFSWARLAASQVPADQVCEDEEA